MTPAERWVEDVEKTVRPDRVVWCDGSAGENERLVEEMLADGTLLLAQVPSGEVGRFGHGDPVRVMLKPVAALAVAA